MLDTTLSDENKNIRDSILSNPSMSKSEKTRIKQSLEAADGVVKEFDKLLKGEIPNDGTSNIGGIAGNRLKSFLDRIDRLEEEKSAVSDDIKDVYSEAKGVGFDVKTMRKILKLRRMPTEKRLEEEELLELYKAAIGLQDSLPFNNEE